MVGDYNVRDHGCSVTDDGTACRNDYICAQVHNVLNVGRHRPTAPVGSSVGVTREIQN